MIPATQAVASADAPPGSDPRRDRLRVVCERFLQDTDRRLAGSLPRVAARDLFAAGAAALTLYQDVSRAERYLELALALWIETGAMPGADPLDAGLCALLWGHILLQPGSLLGPEVRENILANANTAIAAISARHSSADETSARLLEAAGLIVLGEALRDGDAAAEGRSRFEEWLVVVRRHGVHEFAAPSAYATDVCCLASMHRWAQSADVRSEAANALRALWSDIAAHHFSHTGRMVGAHGVEPDILRGAGGIDALTYVEGLPGARPPAHTAGSVPCVLALSLDYRVPVDVLSIAEAPERVLRARFGAAEEEDRTLYLTPEFALGTANGHVGPHDKLFAADLAGDKDLPTISIVPVADGAPYGCLSGKSLIADVAPAHLPMRLGSVQERGIALLMMDVQAPTAIPPTDWSTNIVLPSALKVRAQTGDVVRWMKPGETIEGGEFVFGQWSGRAAVVVRVLRMEGAPEVSLIAEKEARKAGAMRLCFRHQRLEMEMMVVVQPCASEAAFRRLMEEVHGTRVSDVLADGVRSVSARFGQTSLEISRHDESRQVIARSVNGKPFVSPLCEINGMAVSLSAV